MLSLFLHRISEVHVYLCIAATAQDPVGRDLHHLNILLYFTLGILHLFFSFSTKLSQTCEHFDYQGFKFSIR